MVIRSLWLSAIQGDSKGGNRVVIERGQGKVVREGCWGW